MRIPSLIGEASDTLDTHGGNVRAIWKRRIIEEVGKRNKEAYCGARDAVSTKK